MVKKTIEVKICRRADNGQICTQQYADKHPKTTVVEHHKRRLK